MVTSIADCEWASVTKLLVALAVLVASRRGVLGLDDPAGPPGATVRHLLSHASGLGPDSPDPLTRARSQAIYSNAGFEVLAVISTERSAGTPGSRSARTNGHRAAAASRHTRIAPGGSAASGAIGPVTDLLSLGRSSSHRRS